MKLWLLSRRDGYAATWDSCVGFVIRADTEEDARQHAYDSSHEEAVWLDINATRCETIDKEGVAGVILRSFKAG